MNTQELLQLLKENEWEEIGNFLHDSTRYKKGIFTIDVQDRKEKAYIYVYVGHTSKSKSTRDLLIATSIIEQDNNALTLASIKVNIPLQKTIEINTEWTLTNISSLWTDYDLKERLHNPDSKLTMESKAKLTEKLLKSSIARVNRANKVK